jgi:hypothetical protein
MSHILLLKFLNSLSQLLALSEIFPNYRKFSWEVFPDVLSALVRTLHSPTYSERSPSCPSKVQAVRAESE